MIGRNSLLGFFENLWAIKNPVLKEFVSCMILCTLVPWFLNLLDLCIELILYFMIALLFHLIQFKQNDLILFFNFFKFFFLFFLIQFWNIVKLFNWLRFVLQTHEKGFNFLKSFLPLIDFWRKLLFGLEAVVFMVSK